MYADERSDRLIHRINVERFRHVPRGAGREGILNRPIGNPVPISSGNCGESCVESIPYLRDRIHSDLWPELPIEAALKPVSVEWCIDGETHNLADGVHAAIGAPGDDRLHLSRDAEQSLFQISLDGPHVVLTAITVKISAVVCEVDPVGRHI